MKTEKTAQIEVTAQTDHLNSLAQAKPINALAELIWNGFDADAHEVHVTVTEDELGGIQEIRVQDNGSGLPHDEATSAFGNLGGSWKKSSGKTNLEKRILHGKDGKGRFKAFALGRQVVWQSTYETEGEMAEYRITGHKGELKRFTIETPSVTTSTQTGTTVIISQISDELGILSKDGTAVDRLTEYFALYLRDYPSARLFYCGDELSPAAAQKEFREYKLVDIDVGGGEKASAVLQIVEWNSKRDRKLCLCDEGGFTLHEIDAGVRPGSEYSFTAYLRSSVIAELQRDNRLAFEELDPTLKALVDAARNQMRAHFREKKAASASGLVREWKEEGIYPYQGESADELETARRQIFEICALNVHEYLTDFRRADVQSRKFTFRMLREALEESPIALQRILMEVLELPKEKREELAELLDSTTLSAIIEAGKLVADRLAFLKGLEELVFNEVSKKQLKERSQLHRILENETWIFGEEFHLTSSDESLTTVLRNHLKKLRPKDKIAPVRRDDGSEAVIDLLLAREIPQNHKNIREFLVIELKRPQQKIDLEVKGQIEGYALAVVRDVRFDIQNTHWTFLAVSNEITEDAQETITQLGKPIGYFLSKDNYRVGLATWGQILQSCRTRLELFQSKLDYKATTDDGVALLRKRYAKYLPPALLLKDADEKPKDVDEGKG